jgi:peptidoglycan/xylan/chitin deacetylase (PgdA/CDA1 family)
MSGLKGRIKEEILRKVRMEHVRYILPNKLCFYGHLIADTRDHPAWSAYRYPSSTEFSEFIHRLRKMGYETVSLREYLDSPLHRKVTLTTFDDGYAAIHRYGHALLKSLNVPYAVFIHPPGDMPPNFPIRKETKASNLLMDAREIADLKRDGVHIGFHGNSHWNLAATNDRDVILQHVSPPPETAQLLTTPLTYAYPFSGPANYLLHDRALMECGFQHIMDTRGFGSIQNHHFRVPLDIHHTSDRIRNACEYALVSHALSPKSRHKA